MKTQIDSKYRLKTLDELEQENGILNLVSDFPAHYLGVPVSRKFYKEGAVDLAAMRARFNKTARKLGVRPGPHC